MTKPTIFFSHSSNDRKLLTKLKDLFIEKTGGSIDIFLSSDGQSIPFGKNWVHRVEQALGTAKAMFVFITPTSIRSNWLYFESGYAYSKGISVVPVGLLGVDLSIINPPLSLLQGFNVSSEEGLNNIISMVNTELGHRHPESFTAEEFQLLAAPTSYHSDVQLGQHTTALDQILLYVQRDSLPEEGQAIECIREYLASEGHDIESSSTAVDLMGIRFSPHQTGDGKKSLTITVDPYVSDIAMPLAERAIRTISKDGLKGLKLGLNFIKSINLIQDRPKLTGRLYGSSVAFADGKRLRYQNLEFCLDRQRHASNSGATVLGAVTLGIDLLTDELPTGRLRELLDLLFDRGVLFFEQ